jgi:hypothetical protein
MTLPTVSIISGVCQRVWRTLVLLLLAVGVTDAQRAAGLLVRSGTRQVTIPWVTNGAVRYVPLAALARSLGGSVRVTGNSAALDACGIVMRFTVGQRSVELTNVGMESLEAPVLRGAAVWHGRGVGC